MRNVLFLAVAICLMSAQMAFAADKIGVVDMQVIATDSDPAKDARKRMEEKYGKERAALEKEGQALQKEAESLKNASEEKQVAFIRKRRALEEKTRAFAMKVEQDEIKIRQDMVTLVFRATYEVAQRKKFDFVVDVTGGGVLYATQNMDLTQDVLAEVNKLWKASAGK